MIAVLSLLIVFSFSLLAIRTATIALIRTGLSQESAQFQAISAFLGVGFTTGESESVVEHPVRRRVVTILMVCGNIGIVTAMSSVILSLLQMENSSSLILKVSSFFGGLVVLWIIGTSALVDRYVTRGINYLLCRYTDLPIHDYAGLLDLHNDYHISELKVHATDWISYKTLAEAKLRDEGIIVLGIRRQEGEFIGAPRGFTRVLSGDTLIVYGRKSSVKDLDIRKAGHAGDDAHREAVKEQKEIMVEHQQGQTNEATSD